MGGRPKSYSNTAQTLLVVAFLLLSLPIHATDTKAEKNQHTIFALVQRGQTGDTKSIFCNLGSTFAYLYERRSLLHAAATDILQNR